MQTARDLTQALGGRWHGAYGTAPCPVCQPDRRPNQNALTLSDGRAGPLLLAHCKKSGCQFREILAAAGLPPTDRATPPRDPAATADALAIKREGQARRVWQEAVPICGTIAETYLRGRGITGPLPEALRFHPECWHGPTTRRLPAMVALVEGLPRLAVHRTYLRPDGSGKAELPPGTAKMMLGATAGGAVRLAEAPGPLVVAEGIETALSLPQLLDQPATVWAALSASGMAALSLPDTPGDLTIASDGDAPGRQAAERLADRAHALGWRVSLLPSPMGMDWNDVLQARKGDAA